MNNEFLHTFRKHIRSLERAVENQLKIGTYCCEVSLAQCHTLLELGEKKQATISDLADTLHLDKSTLSRTIDNLVKLGLVERVIDETDRRYMQVALTEEGEKRFATINQFCDQYYTAFFSHIPEASHSTVLESLEMMTKAFDNMQAEWERKHKGMLQNCRCEQKING